MSIRGDSYLLLIGIAIGLAIGLAMNLHRTRTLTLWVTTNPEQTVIQHLIEGKSAETLYEIEHKPGESVGSRLVITSM